MTPQELNRTIEFVIQSQARLAVAQEQDKEWARGLFGQLALQDKRLVELIEIQSRRLDRAEREDRAAQKRHDQLLRQIRERKS